MVKKNLNVKLHSVVKKPVDSFIFKYFKHQQHKVLVTLIISLMFFIIVYDEYYIKTLKNFRIIFKLFFWKTTKTLRGIKMKFLIYNLFYRRD